MDNIKVSVLCLVYNHEKFLARCLDGFVNQITDFDFEIIIHDDCSNDCSLEIIKKYEKTYNGLIKVMTEEENQYSKGTAIVNDLMFPNSKGEYIAICEGDDYWNDNYKLQRQYDYMREHKDVSLCVHNTKKHDLSGKAKDKNFFIWKDVHVLSPEDAIVNWSVHTSSYMFRREFIKHEELRKKIWCGDYLRLLYALSKGKIVALPQVMSVYNYNNTEGLTWKLHNSNKKIERWKEIIELLDSYDSYTHNRFSTATAKKRLFLKYDIMVAELQNKVESSDDKRIQTYKKESKSYRNSHEYKDRIKMVSVQRKIKQYLLFSNYFAYKLKVFLKKQRYN